MFNINKRLNVTIIKIKCQRKLTQNYYCNKEDDYLCKLVKKIYDIIFITSNVINSSKTNLQT